MERHPQAKAHRPQQRKAAGPLGASLNPPTGTRLGQSAVQMVAKNDQKAVTQRVTDEEHKALYNPYGKPLGLRFQPGKGLPKEEISGDQYGLQDDRYGPDKVDAKEYTKRLNQTIESAVGKQRGWFVSDNKLTLGQTFDKVRAQGQLSIMASPFRGWRKDYGEVFGSVGKRPIAPKDFMIRIPLINVWDYDKYKHRLDEPYQESWNTEIWPDIVHNLKSRVYDAVTLALGGKLSQYNLGPSFDPDPKEFLTSMAEMEEEMMKD